MRGEQQKRTMPLLPFDATSTGATDGSTDRGSV
jgi:hypothetical protein